MAKFALVNTLRRAYNIARLSHKSTIPPNELIEILHQKTSRRRLLQGGLFAAGAIAGVTLSHKQHSIAVGASSKVLIVGAGIAGLTAAYRLHQAGVGVDIVEARNQIGGRIRSLANAAGTSTTVELGGEFIDSEHKNIQALAAELGLNIGDLHTADRGLTEDTWYFDGRKIPLEQIVKDFMPLAPIIEKDAAIAEDLESPAAIKLDQTSITQYLAQQPISPTLRELIATAYTVEYGREAAEQSSLNLIYLIGTDTAEFSIYGDSDERYHIIGGNQQLLQRLAQPLASFIETGTELEAIRSLPDGRYRASFRAGTRVFERNYERVLLTIPFSVLRTVRLAVDLPPAKRQVINGLCYGTNSKLITAYKERVWRDRYKSTASVFTDLGFQNTWEPARYASGKSGLITNFCGGRYGVEVGRGTAEAQAQKFHGQIEKVFPGLCRQRTGAAIRAYWTGEQYSAGSYACYLVGQWAPFYGKEGERVGNLLFAGEHCSQDYQGYMEGGCETGEIAAQEILQDLNIIN
ncbi:flavin monoamine oxidase family protein [Gloeocapsopsis dulcis]|uniref:Monoamine oxidase n=1 Tax=Gloeocapsopsis dulcis AAB1 = 1H9 TaxID=1433147 RepID=A0A6N8FWX1_9CHRO|nr:NAD(P)/FAD-dependent oxidoreductase [Gloeocapsopsis dulcis]MUL37112.1 monoamine oxidase [Gloeocapsopsis dulcis AAB1 = 1H9]WNN88397.1 NAD(P)/FAD-dependent oxidoreductase [Gloeocapsopsis dulcis]